MKWRKTLATKKPVNKKSNAKKTIKKERMRMNPAQRIFFINLLAEGRSISEIQDACAKYPEPFYPSERVIQNWRTKTKNKVNDMKRNQEGAVWSEGLAKSEERIKVLKTIAERMLTDLIAEDPANEKVWLNRMKGIGTGPNFIPYTYKEFNAGQIKELRGLLNDIALETGGRDPKSAAASITGMRDRNFSIPAHLIAPDFLATYRDIRSRGNLEYVLKGGRGSTKSSFTALVFIELLIANPLVHGLAVREIASTLRESVFNQLRWAILKLGLDDQFKITMNPLEIEYLPTGQKIYFRGGSDPIKIKSITPPFGYVGLLWLEELDQFRGGEAVRSIEQSAIRGGEIAYIFKTFNPPKTKANWANKYILIPKDNRLVHHSTYLNVPPEWLGQPWIDEAEHLKKVNPNAYDHEYLGQSNGSGGLVFDNVELRKITKAEIAQFDRVRGGIDWGYFPDPFSVGKMHYDASRMTVYIYKEFRGHKLSNQQLYDKLYKELKIFTVNDLVIADSAEPKSVADFRAYGANIRGAEKGPESVNYSMKWLQSRAKIVIDDQEAPYHAEEFVNYELEKDKAGEFITAYPDKDNHSIDDTRYGLNLEWRRRGE